MKPKFLGGICVLVFLSYTQNLIPMLVKNDKPCLWLRGAHWGTGEVFLQLILLPIGPNAVAGVVGNWGRFSYLIFCKLFFLQLISLPIAPNVVAAVVEKGGEGVGGSFILRYTKTTT